MGLQIAKPVDMPKGYELKSQVKISTEARSCIWSGQKEYVLKPVNTPSGHLTSVCYSPPWTDSFSESITTLKALFHALCLGKISVDF